MTPLVPLSDVAELDSAIAESHERPVLLFKHSRTCGISCEALDELRAHLDTAPTSAAYRMVTVQSHRGIAEAIAARLGIRHETPQAIVVRGGRPVWNASHFRITTERLTAALAGQ
jgi:bacillithiol system protein YtxJ